MKFGDFFLAGCIVSIVGLISSLGLGTVLVRDIPRDKYRTGTMVISSLILRLPLAFVGAVLGLMVGKAIGCSNEVLLYIGIYLIGSIVGVFSDTVNSAVRGLETFSFSNFGAIIDKVVSSVIVITVVIIKGPFWIIVASTVLSGLFSVCYMARGLAGRDIVWQMPTKSEMWEMARAGVPFLSAGVFAAIYGKSDALFMKQLSTEANIGWYGFTTRIAGAAMALPTTVCSAMLPALSALYRENVPLFIDGASRLLNLMVICCVPIAATMICCSGPLVALFSDHTASFKPAAPSVVIYGIAIVLYFLSQGAANAVIACDQQRIFGKAMGIAAVASVPITALCIYVGQKYFRNGSAGACVSDLIPEVFLLCSYLYCLPKGTVSLSLLSTAAKAVLAAVPLIAEFYLVPSKFVLVGAVPCFAVYALLCWKFGCLHEKDVNVLKSMVKGKFGGAAA